MKIEKNKWKVQISDGHCIWEYVLIGNKAKLKHSCIDDVIQKVQEQLGFVDEAECLSEENKEASMKIVLIYQDYLSSRTRKLIRKEWDENRLVILEGGPTLHEVNEEFEEMIIKDFPGPRPQPSPLLKGKK